jgi:hypothetical protein
MSKRMLASVAIGLALPLTLVGSAAADFGDDVRDSITVPSGSGIRDQVDISPEFSSDDDAGDDESFDVPSSGDFSGIGGAVRDRVHGDD